MIKARSNTNARPSALPNNPTIVVLDDFHRVFDRSPEFRVLGQNANLVIYTDRAETPEALTRRLEEADIMVPIRRRSTLDGALLRQLPRLKAIVQAGGVFPHIDLDTATELRIPVLGTRAIGSQSVAELEFGLILSIWRNIPQLIQVVRGGRWHGWVGRELHGKTLGTIGLGAIGSRVSMIANGFGMRVLAYSRSLTQQQASKVGANAVTFEEVLHQSDIVTLHVNLTPATQNMIGSRELDLMKRDAILVNTSRGALIDETVLVEALRTKKIAGALLDVLVDEPPRPDNPLLSLDNVFITPHIGWQTWEGYDRFVYGCMQNIKSLLAGRPTNVVNPLALVS